MQLIKCVQCGAPLANVDARGNVYDIKAGRDDIPRSRVDEKGNPRQERIKRESMYTLGDRVTKTEIVEKTIVEVEEPHTITCKCGQINKIY